MKFKARVAALWVAGSLSLVAVAVPANAASVISEAFLANVRPNVDFLQRSSRLAAGRSASKGIRAFARGEDTEQATAVGAINTWVQANTLRGTLGLMTIDGRAVPSPVDVAEVPVAATTDLVTGRSAALDVPVAIDTSPETRRELLPAGQSDLDRLAARRGRSFDRLYRGTQLDALRQLSTLYATYIQNGDDPTLRAMAVEELPKVNRRIALIRRL